MPDPNAAAAPAPPAADDHDDGSAPGRSPGYRAPAARPAPLWEVMQAWSPVAAGVLRATAGLVMFAASLLTLPTTMATPFLTGVSLVMVIGGVAAVGKACRGDDRLRAFGRWFPIGAAALAGAAVVATLVLGAGAFAPDLRRPAPAPIDDGAVRFSAP